MDQRSASSPSPSATSATSRAFFVDGLGWEPAVYVPGEVLMFKVADKVVLSLWDADHFEAEIGAPPALGGVPPVTLAHNCATKDGVDRVLETARRAGSGDVRAAQEREWGGYTGYFTDPDGFRWEIAYNPGEIGQCGPALTSMCLVGGVTDDKTVLTEDDVAAEQLVAWTYDAAEGGRLTATFDTGDFATGLALDQQDRRAGRGGQPPPRPDADLPDARRAADQPRRRRGDRPRRPDGAVDHRARRGSRRDAGDRLTAPEPPGCGTAVPYPGTPGTLG